MSDCIKVYEIKAIPYLIYLGKCFLDGCTVSEKPSGIIYYCLMGVLSFSVSSSHNCEVWFQRTKC